MAIEKFIVLAAILMAALTAEGQVPSCASSLIPCASYLNATSAPPASCCVPLKAAVTNEMPCLCKVYNSPDLLKAFNINITKVMALPQLCGMHADQTVCKKSLSNSTSNSTTAVTPPSSSPTPPSSSTTPGTGSGSSKDTSGTFGGPTLIGMTGLVSLTLLCWSIVAL